MDLDLLLPELVDRLVAGDPHQVLLDVVAAVEALDATDGSEEDVLGQVFGEVDVADLALQKPEDAVVILLAEPRPLGVVERLELRDVVVGRAHIANLLDACFEDNVPRPEAAPANARH